MGLTTTFVILYLTVPKWRSMSSMVVHVEAGLLGRQDQHFLEEPQSTTVTSGTTLVLSCQVSNMVGVCQWTKDGFGLGTEGGLPGYPRYSMVEPGCSLQIMPVLVEDEGAYTCQIGPGVSQGHAIVSSTAYLKVNVEPGKPFIVQGIESTMIGVEEGKELELECKSQGGRPSAELHWMDVNGVEVLGQQREEVTKVPNNIKTFSTTSRIRFSPVKDLEILCSVTSEAFPIPTNTRPLMIKIKYRPKVVMDLTEETQEGQDLTVRCLATAYPEEMKYSWYINDNLVPDQIEDTFTLGQLTEELNNAEIMCRVENQVGVSEKRQKLNVVFKPRIIKQPGSTVARQGEEVSFFCKALGNPEPKYVWVKQSTGEMVGVTMNLTLVASNSTEDNYTCKAFVTGYGELISDIASLIVLRGPKVFMEKVRRAKIGQTVVLQCKVETFSFNTSVAWTKNSQPLGHKFIKERVVQNEEMLTIQSDLIMVNLTMEDFSKYGCFASNEVSTDYKEISIELEKESWFGAVSWILVSLLCLSCCVFLIFHHWRRMASFLSSQTCFARLQSIDAADEDEGGNEVKLPPIFKGEDFDIFDEILLNDGMDEDQKYQQMCREYTDNHERPAVLRQRSINWRAESLEAVRDRRLH